MKKHSVHFSVALILCVVTQVRAADGLKTKDIHQAARIGALDEVAVHIAAGADVNEFNSSGESPLAVAAMNGRQPIVELLLDQGADINARNQRGWTAVMSAGLAESFGRPVARTVDYLIEHGAEFDVFDAAEVGHSRRVKQLVEQDSALVNAKGAQGQTLLHVAALGGHAKMVKILIDAGADVDATDTLGQTALVACMNSMGKEEVVKLLTEAGAAPDKRPFARGTTLHQAAGVGDTAAAKALLEAGADVNKCVMFNPGTAPIHEAAQHGHVEMVRLLAAHGADLNATDNFGRTPLQLAIRGGHKKVEEVLRELGAGTTVHDAVASGDIDRVRSLIETGWSDVGAVDDVDEGPLHVAAREGKTEIVKMLLEQGADVNARDQDGNTPLHAAAEHGHTETVEVLLDEGANIDAVDGSGHTPLGLAAVRNRHGVTELLLSRGADPNVRELYGRTRLHWACVSGSVKQVELLLEYGADVSARDDNGDTPLHTIAGSRDIWVRSIPDLELPRDRTKWTHYHKREVARSYPIAELLLENGADLNARNIYEMTPLHIAASKGRDDLAELFLDRGAPLNVPSPKGMPIHQAAAGGYPEVVQLLLDRGAFVYDRDDLRKTPLHYAAWNQRELTVRKLIESGARVDDVDQYGNSPLHYAAYGGMNDMVELLVQYGADINLLNNAKMTPLTVALRLEQYDAADRIRELGGVEIRGESAGGEGIYIGTPEEVAEMKARAAEAEAARKRAEASSRIADERSMPDQDWEFLGRWIDENLEVAGETFKPTDTFSLHLLQMAAYMGNRRAQMILRDLDTEALQREFSAKEVADASAAFSKTNPMLEEADGSWSPLHYAAAAGSVEGVKILVEGGADVNVKTSAGETPLALARRANQTDIVALLKQNGAEE